MSEVVRLFRMAEEKPPGPPSIYTQAHLLLALLTIGDSPNLGRHLLARRMGVGEGVVRTLLRKLKDGGLLRVTNTGASLTAKGSGAYAGAKRFIPRLVPLGQTDLTAGERQVALIIRRAAKRVGRGIEQRDAAVRSGADGATTYVICGSKFQIPMGSKNCEKDFPGAIWGTMRKELKPRDEDVVIICGSRDEATSTIGAISAALTLLSPAGH